MGGRFTFYFVVESKFEVQVPRGAYIRTGNLTVVFLRYDLEGLIHGGAYFRNFYGISCTDSKVSAILHNIINRTTIK